MAPIRARRFASAIPAYVSAARPRRSRVNLQGRFPFLDGLRALAAVSVMLFHFFNHWVSPLHKPLAAILPSTAQFFLLHGDLGVEVFFVLSGFVIAHSLFEKAVTPAYAGNFILRRSLRLDPPYWVVIGISIGLPFVFFPQAAQHIFRGFGGPTGMLVNMFYLPDLLWQPRIVGVAWTLCIEVQFYLAFLLLLMFIHGLKSILPERRCWIATTIVAAGCSLLLVYSVHRWFSAGRNDFGGRWFMFFTGVLAYWTLAGQINRKLFFLYMAAILGLCISFREPRTAMVLFTTLTIYASAFTGGLQTWLSGRALRYLARISYSLYLVHMTVGVATIHLVMRFTQGSNTAVLAAFAAAIIVSILTADLLNRFVEAPALCLSKRLKGVGARETRSIGIFAAFARLSFRMPLRVEVN